MIHNAANENTVRPIPAMGAAGWFALYGAALFISFHFVMPQLWRVGLSSAESLLACMMIPLALMLLPPIIIYRQENRSMSLRSMLIHWRYPRITWRDFAWALLIIAVALPLAGIMMVFNKWLIAQGWLTIPDYVPAVFNPLADLTDKATWDGLVGGNIRGNWRLVILYFTLLFFNITGEEVLWRGYLLPRQEAQHGRWAWLIHGLMWTVFHAFNWWGMLPIMPICLMIAWTSQHTGRNWSAYIAHYFFNCSGFLIALAFAAGWM